MSITYKGKEIKHVVRVPYCDLCNNFSQVLLLLDNGEVVGNCHRHLEEQRILLPLDDQKMIILPESLDSFKWEPKEPK